MTESKKGIYTLYCDYLDPKEFSSLEDAEKQIAEWFSNDVHTFMRIKNDYNDYLKSMGLCWWDVSFDDYKNAQNTDIIETYHIKNEDSSKCYYYYLEDYINTGKIIRR